MQPPMHRWTYTDHVGHTTTLEFTDPVMMGDIVEKFEAYLHLLSFNPAGKLEWVPKDEDTEGYGEEPKFI